MTKKADYTVEEWAALSRAPLLAGMAISVADPGGPIELTKESLATLRSIRTPPGDAELLTAVSQDVQARLAEHEKPLKEIDLKSRHAREQIVEELKRVNPILDEKATPEEAAGFREWLLHTAEEAAKAAKEGGFFGIGAVQVSEREAAMLVRIRSVLGMEPE
jgi:hypothetical protein